MHVGFIKRQLQSIFIYLFVYSQALPPRQGGFKEHAPLQGPKSEKNKNKQTNMQNTTKRIITNITLTRPTIIIYGQQALSQKRDFEDVPRKVK